MKINEKNLCVFATTPPFDLEGYLNKRGEVNKAWQKRYFVLKGNLLFYFEKKGDKEPLGLIILEGCIIELAEDSEPYSFQIVFNGNRTYILGADCQESMELWMKSLTCAGYEYKKLLLAELQRQLEEIEGSQKKQIQDAIQPVAPKPPPRRQNPFNRPAPPPPTFISHVNNDNQSKTAASTTAVATTPENCDVFNDIGAGSLSLGVNGKSVIHSNSGSITAAGCDNTEFTFQSVHEAFRRVILEDLKACRKRMEDNQKPLIEL